MCCDTTWSVNPRSHQVDGEIMQAEQQPANAEARAEATSLLRELQEQASGSQINTEGGDHSFHADEPSDGALDIDAQTQHLEASMADGDALGVDSATAIAKTTANNQDADVAMEDAPVAPLTGSGGKPLVEAPEFGERVRDTDKEPFWIPGAFPTIFQNETGDLHNYTLKEPDMLTWGPHIMRSYGWHAQVSFFIPDHHVVVYTLVL